MKISTVMFLTLSDVLTSLGCTDIYDCGDPFEGELFGDASHTLMPLPWVLDKISQFLSAEDMEHNATQFAEAAHTLLASKVPFVDMEN